MPSPGRLAGLAWRGVRYELSLYRSLLRWVARRPSVPAGSRPVGYARLVSPLLWLWIFGSAVEIPVAHVLLPWESVRGVVLVLGVWGLMWMLGMLASLRVHPHLLTDDGIRVRHGALIDVAVPWAEVERADAVSRDLPSSLWTLQQEVEDDGVHLHVAVSGSTNVRLVLRRPVTVRTPRGPLDVVRLSLLADEPRELVAEVRRRVAERSASPAG